MLTESEIYPLKSVISSKFACDCLAKSLIICAIASNWKNVSKVMPLDLYTV